MVYLSVLLITHKARICILKYLLLVSFVVFVVGSNPTAFFHVNITKYKTTAETTPMVNGAKCFSGGYIICGYTHHFG